MKNTRLAGSAAIIVMLLLCFGAGFLYHSKHAYIVKNTYKDALTKAPDYEDPLEGISEETDFAVSEDFETHLPLVVLDFGENDEPPITTMADETGVFHVIEGIEPYIEGGFYLINNENGTNHANDVPQISTDMKIKRRGNSSMQYAKAQWMVKFLTESGQYRDLDVLGMGEEHEWILNGSLYDKSSMRNYLAYSIGSEFMEFTPDYQICEVLTKKNGQLYYQGVYLLGENIKQGPDRVNIADYKPNKKVNSYMIRRDRFDDEGIMLDTYGRLNGYEGNQYLGIIEPSVKEISDEMVSFIEKDINTIEQVLYSENDSVFYTYPDVIDVDSFVDYFLLNEFFISYDAGLNSTYAYKDYGGKLKMGPIWDFDGTMDNYWKEPANVEDIAFQGKAWFNALCTDKAFVQKLINRYVELRRTSFSDAHITEKINEIIDHVGAAEEREWARWGIWYTEAYLSPSHIGLQDYETEDGTILHRNAESFTEEMYRIRTVLHDHGEKMPEALMGVYNIAERNSAAEKWTGWLLLAAALIFLLPAAYVALKA